MIRHVIESHNDPIPAVLEIPSKECPYDASKDSILRRAKVINQKGYKKFQSKETDLTVLF